MQPGEMKSKIDIVEFKSTGPFGGQEVAVCSSMWAKKEQLIGAQLVQAMGEGDRIPCNFIIRRNDTITNRMIVKHKENKYDIKSTIPLPNNPEYTILTCFEVM